MFRIIVLAAMGLGAMYMMHLLAQDFQRIRRPIQNAVRSFIYKRDVMAATHHQHYMRPLPSLPLHHEPVTLDGAEVNWNRVLRNDPLNCALSLVCALAAGAEDQNSEANHINAFVQYSIHTNNAPPKIITAHRRGNSKRADPQPSANCYAEYPHCPYSARTMLYILDLHAYLFRGEEQTTTKAGNGRRVVADDGVA